MQTKLEIYKEKLLTDGCKKRTTGILHQMRKRCKDCILGERKEIRKHGDKTMEILIPAKCMKYKKDGKKCYLPINSMIRKVEAYIAIEKVSADELQKALINQSIADAEYNRIVETETKGSPKFYTNIFQEQALKYNSERLKILNPTKDSNLHLHGDMADKIWDKIFSGTPVKKKEEKVIEVEAKEVEDVSEE